MLAGRIVGRIDQQRRARGAAEHLHLEARELVAQRRGARRVDLVDAEEIAHDGVIEGAVHHRRVGALGGAGRRPGVVAVGVQAHEQVCLLAHEGAVRCHDELHVGEVTLQPRAERTLPRGVQVLLRLVDEHDAGVRHDEMAVARVDLELAERAVHLRDEVEHQRRHHAEARTQLVEGGLLAVAPPRPEAVGVDPCDRHAVGEEPVVEET